ncbi:MAG: hopanoid biosynthesis-associated protein HpnK [Alphaproteobacteria bacterium]|nr:hopanoid biosynthesis-associated protein HpnK [Alphaproteobacteria bacterium]
MKRLIVTGDDFGISIPVNEAIEAAHSNGILTATCLMVGEPEVRDAIARAKRHPDLGVGLHIVVARGRSTLPPDQLSSIAPNGFLEDNLVRAGFRYFFSPRARRQLSAEIRAQFRAFRDTGLALDHVNAHNHMHLHPIVLSCILENAAEFGIKAVRLPAEKNGGLGAVLLSPWISLMRWRLRRAGIRYNDQIIGITETGTLNQTQLLSAITKLRDGVTEIFSHPATGDWEGMDPAASDFKFKEEFDALISPDVAAAIANSDIKLSTYRDI